MAGLPSLRGTSICFACIRRLARDDLSESLFPFQRQLRGKKKTAKRPTTVNVRLLEDIQGYGKKGELQDMTRRASVVLTIPLQVQLPRLNQVECGIHGIHGREQNI